jgi:negative regulator of sigma E activity
MMSNSPTDHDREILSALFDGELDGDAARFALKRLGHDPQWRRALGNWQWSGDAMRGQASRAAPADFAARVATAVADEATAGSDPGLTSARAPAAVGLRRKWMGGAALAASVAMVAMFVARPFSQDTTSGGRSPVPATAEFSAPPAAAPAPARAATHPMVPEGALPLATAAAAVADADVPRRAGDRRSRGQSQRAALRASRRQAPAPGMIAASAAVAIGSEPLHGSPASPFHPPTEAVVRPWPRAVLPAAEASAAFTASYGGDPAGSPSFYPFEPRLPGSAEVPLATDAQRP